MKISGKPLAETILTELKQTIQTNNLHPQLAIILANDDPSSRVYISRKIKAAEPTGIKVSMYEFLATAEEAAISTIQTINNQSEVSGIIVQLPLYSSWQTNQFLSAVIPQKDVDGFLPNSPYVPATAAATWEMLTTFAHHEKFSTPNEFLQNKSIVIVGPGKTAGAPIIHLLQAHGFSPQVVDWDTPNPDSITKQADVLISAVGQKHIIRANNIKPNSYIIGIGVTKEQAGDNSEKIVGDVHEEEIKDIVKLYCPTIGGIGPLTIACLLKNVVQAAGQTS